MIKSADADALIDFVVVLLIVWRFRPTLDERQQPLSGTEGSDVAGHYDSRQFGNQNRFETNKDTSHKHSLLKLEVYNSGKITYTGKISSGDNEPIIVVGFQNNHDGYDNIRNRSKCLMKPLMN